MNLSTLNIRMFKNKCFPESVLAGQIVCLCISFQLSYRLSCLPSLLTLFLLLSVQLGITGLHIIFCSTSESRLFKISVIFLSRCVYLMGLFVHLQKERERACCERELHAMHQNAVTSERRACCLMSCSNK